MEVTLGTWPLVSVFDRDIDTCTCENKWVFDLTTNKLRPKLVQCPKCKEDNEQ